MIGILLCILSSLVIVGAGAWVVPLVRARNRRRLVAQMHGAAGDASGEVGFSLLCCGVRRPGQIENLLSSEYDRCEVVVVLDAVRRRALFERLASRYRMIRVDYLPSEEFSVQGVRSMWRSRKRCFRRLVLLDRAEETPAGACDAAASVAAYDWLLPVRDGQYMLPGTLERLAVEIGQGAPGAICSWVGEPCTVFDRERVVAAGGFGSLRGFGGFGSRRTHRSTRWLWEPLFYRPALSRRRRAWRVWAAPVLGGAVVAAAWTGLWSLAALLSTGAVAWCAEACAAQLLSEMAGRNVRSGIGPRNFAKW